MGILDRINRYYDGSDWPYECGGVGISLEGAPTDVGAFLDLLHAESCNPPAARRILADLEAGLVKRTTLMSSLDFNRIGDSLAALGVRMRVIPPIVPAVPIAVDAEVLSRYVGQQPRPMESEEQEQLVASRLSQFDESIAARPHDFGPFEWIRKKAA
ncbi:hypothetical protein [Paraburkholderia sp. A3RO-2L]|jgi:hypothetical protein|uniref:hypothetical protein n=1 Tax=Paraburkholderia sp. A3RO-2L TaxID=3028376 RepID=UPI003DA7B413